MALPAVWRHGVLDRAPEAERAFLRRHLDSLDISQSVFREVIRDLPGFEDRGEPAFRRWLEVKARGKVDMNYRKHLRPGGGRREESLEEIPVAAEEPGPASIAVLAERWLLVRHALGELGERDRRVLRLRIEENLPRAEVARRMGLPGAQAARKACARALVRLRSRLPEGLLEEGTS